MIDNKNIVEKLYISLNITCLTLVAIYMMVTKEYTSELTHFQINVSSIELALLLMYSIAGFVLVYLFYVLTRNRKFSSSFSHLRVNSRRLSLVFFALLIAQFIFLIVTGVGRVGSQATSPYSPVFSLLNIDGLFGFFYFLARRSHQISRLSYWFIVFTYLIFKILQGWTGVILLISFFEIYFYFESHIFKSWSRIVIILFVPFLLLLSGGEAYYYIFPYKFEIRGLGFSEMSYPESVIKLTNRLTFFPISVGVYERNSEIQNLALQDDSPLRETKGFFRPIAPRSLMANKEFRSLNNLAVQAFYPDVDITTSSDIGFIMYVVTLFSTSIADGITWLILTFYLLIINKIIIDAFEQYRGQLNFLYFLLIVKLYYTASPEVVFAYGSIGMLFLLPLMFVTGAVRFNNLRYERKI